MRNYLGVDKGEVIEVMGDVDEEEGTDRNFDFYFSSSSNCFNFAVYVLFKSCIFIRFVDDNYGLRILWLLE